MKSDMENKDWLNDYKLLKQINPGNPFTVPAGYFDELGDRIVAGKNLDDLKNSALIHGFTVPENYFEELAGNMQSIIAIENELNSNDTGFTVPDGYFNNLQQQINSRISIEMAMGEQTDHFSVPDGYFDQLNTDILNKTVNVNTKRGGVVRKLFTSTSFKYATAACFALAIGGGILLSGLNNSVDEHKNSFLHTQLSKVPVDEIKNYLQLNVDAGDTQQTAATVGVVVDANSLKNAIQDAVDSVQ